MIDSDALASAASFRNENTSTKARDRFGTHPWYLRPEVLEQAYERTRITLFVRPSGRTYLAVMLAMRQHYGHRFIHEGDSFTRRHRVRRVPRELSGCLC